ncbi:MAG TPA: hypothetical protein VNG53_10840, partial [Bacteroidia bacterium]|nr:hypothetical protein [Bacteroidia bacterium]
MVNSKTILFTFDYELFLGERSGTVDKCLIEPTNRLLEILEQYNFKAIFFVDTTYLIRLSEVSKNNEKAFCDFEKIKMQLRKIAEKKHEIFPHIHPHWLDAVYLEEINQWQLKKNDKYRFSSLVVEDKEMLFEKSFFILNEILQQINIGFKIDSYRAGGWCIQPFSDFIPYFEKHKIINEFSVLRGVSNFNDVQYFDFEITPKKNIYRFKDDICIEDSNGKYVQYSISTIKINKWSKFIERILLKYLWKMGNRSIGDGNGLATKKTQLHYKISSNLEMISIELLTKVKLPIYLKNIKKNNYT